MCTCAIYRPEQLPSARIRLTPNNSSCWQRLVTGRRICMCSFFRLTTETVNGYNGAHSFHPHTFKFPRTEAMMISISDFRASLGLCGFTADAVTAIEQNGFDTMDKISISTNSGFKTMLKTLQERTAITIQYSAVNKVFTNAPVVVSAHAGQCF